MNAEMLTDPYGDSDGGSLASSTNQYTSLADEIYSPSKVYPAWEKSKELLKIYFPFATWLPQYKGTAFPKDCLAGFTVGVRAIKALFNSLNI